MGRRWNRRTIDEALFLAGRIGWHTISGSIRNRRRIVGHGGRAFLGLFLGCDADEGGEGVGELTDAVLVFTSVGDIVLACWCGCDARMQRALYDDRLYFALDEEDR